MTRAVYNARVDEATLDMLRSKGVTRATFHTDGSLASVDFGHTDDARSSDFSTTPATDVKRSLRRVGIVPREPPDSA